VHEIETFVKPTAACRHFPTGRVEVVGPPAHGDAEREPTTRKPIERGRFLGQKHEVASRREQNIGAQANARGHGCRCREDRDLLMAGVCDAPDGRQR
jgi:hypothetical protein